MFGLKNNRGLRVIAIILFFIVFMILYTLVVMHITKKSISKGHSYGVVVAPSKNDDFDYKNYKIVIYEKCAECSANYSFISTIIPDNKKCSIRITNYSKRLLYSGVLEDYECKSINRLSKAFKKNENNYYSENVSDGYNTKIEVYVDNYSYKMSYERFAISEFILGYKQNESDALFIIMYIAGRYTEMARTHQDTDP